MSYDYQFDAKNGKFVCFCGADNCRGTMKDNVREEEDIHMKDKRNLAQLKFTSDLNYIKEVINNSQKRFHPLLMMARGEWEAIGMEGELEDKDTVRKYGVFLYRNLMESSNFLKKEKLWKIALLKKKKKKTVTKIPHYIRTVDVISLLNK